MCAFAFAFERLRVRSQLNFASDLTFKLFNKRIYTVEPLENGFGHELEIASDRQHIAIAEC